MNQLHVRSKFVFPPERFLTVSIRTLVLVWRYMGRFNMPDQDCFIGEPSTVCASLPAAFEGLRMVSEKRIVLLLQL